MSVTASAPGKLVLFGDHAVVYGFPGLVTAVDLRFYITLDSRNEPIVSISTPALEAKGEFYQISLDQISPQNRPETAFVEAALKQMLLRYPLEGGLHIATQGPALSYGLGSSSAVCAALVKALAKLMELDLSPRQIFDIAYTAVLDVQGIGSGVDLAAAIYGGTVYYIKGGIIIEPLENVDLPLVIAYSGIKVSTTNLIAQVAEHRTREPDYIESLFQRIGQISVAARQALLSAEWLALGNLINEHQTILEALNVSTPRLDRLISAARDAGAFGAKLSGAGGGDCMFALTSLTTRSQIERHISAAGGEIVDVRPNAAGVRIEPA